MPILFSISVLALVALLWAAFSAAQHIRRARRRKRRALGPELVASVPGSMGLQLAPTPAAMLAVHFEELTPFVEAAVSRPVVLSSSPEPSAQRERQAEPPPRAPMVTPEPPYIPLPAYVPKLTFARVSPFISVGDLPAKTQPMQASFPQVVDRAPARHPGLGTFSSARIRTEQDKSEQDKAEQDKIEQDKREEQAAKSTAAPISESAGVAPAVPGIPAAASIEKASLPKKPSTGFPAVSGRHTVAGLAGKMERPDWAYFNKDMGDLTDPYETPRTRPKIASGDSRR